jgi:16S rRNA (guanine1207-N2)-methyltransferase
MSNVPSSDSPAMRLPPRVEEQRLIEVSPTIPGERFGVFSLGRAQLAEQLAEGNSARVFAWYFDGYQAELARRHALEGARHRVVCKADWPDEELDAGFLCVSQSGEAELTRELIQSAYHRLAIGGTLAVSVDNPKDRWLHDILKAYNKRVRVRNFDDAIVYLIDKQADLKKLKDYSCTVEFRDCDETIRMVTRPGVFSHREFDQGAKQLLDAVDVYPEAKLLDIGCGAGAVTLGLAARDPSSRIFGFDSNARAVDCVQRGAVLNGLENIVVDQHWTGDYREENSFDMALANPPYFGDMRIAEWFMQVAYSGLRPGGRLVLVNKQPRWYEENMPKLFKEVEVFESRKYHIASGVK